MFTKFKRDITTVFLDPLVEQTFSYKKGEKINIILSPSIYWVKKLKLPVKSVREVKKLLPSIFEDSLPEGNYSYFVYKKEEDFFLFAYDDKKIFELLSKVNIAYGDVASVHFAQSEFSQMSSAFCVNEKQCMYLKDELLILAPSAWIEEKEKLNLENIKLSHHTIQLQQFSHIVDNASLYKIAAILAVLAIILIVEIFIATAKKEQIVEAKEKLFSKYKLQSTTFQNRSSFEKYSKIDARQKKVREYISYFLNMKLQNGQKIIVISYKDNFMKVTINGVQKAKSTAIMQQLKDKKVKFDVSFMEENMRVEMKI